jgi:hypothetical protein
MKSNIMNDSLNFRIGNYILHNEKFDEIVEIDEEKNLVRTKKGATIHKDSIKSLLPSHDLLIDLGFEKVEGKRLCLLPREDYYVIDVCCGNQLIVIKEESGYCFAYGKPGAFYEVEFQPIIGVHQIQNEYFRCSQKNLKLKSIK